MHGHDHTDIQGAYSAKMSTPYSTAVALIYGKAGLQEFEKEVLEDKTIQELTRKVEVVADDKLSGIFPEKQSAILTITTSKNEYSERVDFPKGEPENPLTDQEFYDRYAALMSYGNIEKITFHSVYEMVDKPNVKVSELISKL